MGSTTVVVRDELLTSTGMAHLDEVRVMNDRPHPIVQDMYSLGMEPQSGGERVFVPWEVNDHSEATRIQNGYEGINSTARPTMVPGQENWAYVAQPAFISRYDQLVTRNEFEMVDRWKKRVENVERHLDKTMEEVLLRTALATGTYAGHPAWIDFLSLNGADQNTGFVEPRVTGLNTLHNVAKSPYPPSTHPQFHNAFYDAANSFSLNGLIGLYDLMVQQMDDIGADFAKDYRGYMSKAGANFLKRALQSQERYVDSTTLDGGRVAMTYQGIPLQVTGRMPNSGVSTTANPWTFLFINWKDGVRFIGQTEAVKHMDKVVTIPGSLVQVAIFHLMGQLVCPMPGANALMIRGDQWS